MTTNTLTKIVPGTAVAPATRNPFTAYGNSGASEYIYGTLLKYVKGDWLAGEHQRVIPINTKFVAVMDKMALGYIRWENKRPSAELFALVVSGGAPRRADCGELDRLSWPLDDKGEVKDPWQDSSYIPMINVDSHEIYTFAGSSKGGLGAGKKLSKQYGNLGAAKYPIVALDSSSYDHEEYGRTKIPVFKITGWVEKARYDALLLAGAAAAQGDSDEHENPGYGMDDEIPF